MPLLCIDPVSSHCPWNVSVSQSSCPLPSSLLAVFLAGAYLLLWLQLNMNDSQICSFSSYITPDLQVNITNFTWANSPDPSNVRNEMFTLFLLSCPFFLLKLFLLLSLKFSNFSRELWYNCLPRNRSFSLTSASPHTMNKYPKPISSGEYTFPFPLSMSTTILVWFFIYFCRHYCNSILLRLHDFNSNFLKFSSKAVPEWCKIQSWQHLPFKHFSLSTGSI